MVRLGFNSNSFVGQPLDKTLGYLADLGYQSIGLTPDDGMLDPRHTTPEQLKAIGDRCRKLGLTVVLETGARFLLDGKRKHRPNLLEVDGTADIRLKFLRHMVEWCEILDAQILSFWSGVLPDGQTEVGAEEQFLRSMENLSPLAERRGVTLALEPEPGHWVEDLTDWSRIHAKAEECFSLTLDVGHVLVTEEMEPEEAVRQFLPQIVNIHLDDMNRGVHHHLPPGRGQMNWEKMSLALSSSLLTEVPACWELSRSSEEFLEIAPTANSFLVGLS